MKKMMMMILCECAKLNEVRYIIEMKKKINYYYPIRIKKSTSIQEQSESFSELLKEIETKKQSESQRKISAHAHS